MKKLKTLAITLLLATIAFFLGCLYFNVSPAEALRHLSYILVAAGAILILLFFVKITFKIIGFLLLAIAIIIVLQCTGTIDILNIGG